MQSRIVEISLNKLTPSQANVRKTNRMFGVEELAANIAARGGQIIQSLAVQPVLDGAGAETGAYRVSGGGRRLAALKLLAKRKVIGKTMLIPCIIADGDEDDVSLSENVMREPLHPADQFAAFQRLAERGEGLEAIGARFGVSAGVVRQRLRLASVSPKLMDAYRDGALTLDQLMAYTVNEDHVRQEQVFEQVNSDTRPYIIRRMLTEERVPARDRRAVFVGPEFYCEAGGQITRDLFTDDDGGWFDDPALLDRLVTQKLEAEASELVARDGWKWVAASIDYPDSRGLRRVYPELCDLSDEDQARLDALSERYDSLAADWESAEDIPDDISEDINAVAAEIETLTARRYAFDPEDVARSGAFVILGQDGRARVECGFVRPEDEPAIEPETPELREPSDEAREDADVEEGSIKPISDALTRELTAHRTMALRLALGEHSDVALVAVVHSLALKTFHGPGTEACLDLTPRSVGLGSYAAGIEDGMAGRGVAERHEWWAARMPGNAAQLWAFVVGLDLAERLALLAHCASLTVFAVHEAWDRSGRYTVAADTLARATDLDVATYWKPTTATYFSRVTKAKIIEAVTEAVSVEAARRIEGMAKPAMGEAAEALMASSGWLPDSLRTASPISKEIGAH